MHSMMGEFSAKAQEGNSLHRFILTCKFSRLRRLCGDLCLFGEARARCNSFWKVPELRSQFTAADQRCHVESISRVLCTLAIGLDCMSIPCCARHQLAYKVPITMSRCNRRHWMTSLLQTANSLMIIVDMLNTCTRNKVLNVISPDGAPWI